MSPEQVQGLPLDKRSDIFSVGILLHELLTRQRLFVGASDFQTLELVREAKPTPPSLFNSEVDDKLEQIVMKALSKDINQRYQHASEMQEGEVMASSWRPDERAAVGKKRAGGGAFFFLYLN